jgi:uncharacterized protein (DUF58 family)
MTLTAPPPAKPGLFRRRTQSVPALPTHAPVSAPQPKELPEQLLRRLEFKILKRLDGFFFGDYSGAFYGPSLDLAEVRQYQPGDEVRRIDWNVTARSGGVLHVRQYREEREITAWIIVDGAPSMQFGTRRITKYQLGLEFAGVAARIVTRHGDKIGAMGVSATGLKLVTAGSGRGQALRIISELMTVPAANSANVKAGSSVKSTSGQTSSTESGTHLKDALERVEKSLKRRGLIFVVSDFMRGSDWVEPLSRLSLRHDVVAVRVSDPVERELPKVGGVRFRDPATGQETWVDTGDKAVRAQHQKIVLERNARIESALKRARADSFELHTDKDLVQPILKFAMKRKARR